MTSQPLSTDDFLTKLAEFCDAVRVIWSRTEKWIAENGEVVTRFAGIEALDRGGWLAHTAVNPADFYAFEAEQLATEAESRYRHASAEIELELLGLLTGGGLSELTAGPLKEAVDAHRVGHYRSCTRLVFPALEALVRTDLLGYSRGSQTRLPGLQAFIDRMSIDHLPAPKLQSFKLIEKMQLHFFVPIDSNEMLERFKSSGIPNRHACLHGMIDYQTFQHSINSLLIAIYVLRLVSVFRSTAP